MSRQRPGRPPRSTPASFLAGRWPTLLVMSHPSEWRPLSIWLVASQWLYELALAMLKFKLSTSSSSKLWGRALATSQRKITMHRIKLFFRDPPLPPRPTPFANERSMVASVKDMSSTASPAHHSLPPLSLPATDLVSRVQIKSLPLVLRATERVIIALTLKFHGTYSKRTLFDLMTHDDYSLKLSLSLFQSIETNNVLR